MPGPREGGVGKTTVATNFALSLSRYAPTILVDLDTEGFLCPLLRAQQGEVGEPLHPVVEFVAVAAAEESLSIK